MTVVADVGDRQRGPQTEIYRFGAAQRPGELSMAGEWPSKFGTGRQSCFGCDHVLGRLRGLGWMHGNTGFARRLGQRGEICSLPTWGTVTEVTKPADYLRAAARAPRTWHTASLSKPQLELS
jgi:hypothetical protein